MRGGVVGSGKGRRRAGAWSVEEESGRIDCIQGRWQLLSAGSRSAGRERAIRGVGRCRRRRRLCRALTPVRAREAFWSEASKVRREGRDGFSGLWAIEKRLMTDWRDYEETREIRQYVELVGTYD